MTRVKICGLTRPEDAAFAVEQGAWALGMIMWPRSPRFCTLEQAFEICDAQRRKAELVGVFVDATLDDVARAVEQLGLTAVQLHGSEGPQYCDEIARRVGVAVIKAIRVKDRSSIQELGQYREVDYHLLDTHKAGVPGGTGEVFDWGVLDPRDERVPLLLSGGLTPANVGEAIAVVHPFAVDVASGVESAPGKKDHARVRDFIEQVQLADTVAA